MNAEQKVKWAIVAKTAEWNDETAPEYPFENIDELYSQLVESDQHWDGKREIRCGDVETNIPADSSRHYESKSVAMKMPDNSWVGWTYWYGGGKHAEPEAIEWINKAYDLTCTEEEKVVVVRTFSK